jgi:signal peptidase II
VTRWGWLVIAGLAVIVDQATKQAACSALQADHAVHVLGSFVMLRLVRNYPTAFGGSPLFDVASRAAVLLLVLCLDRILQRHLRAGSAGRIAVGLYIAAAAGNGIDRVRLGYVVDFIRIGRWPVFNVADIALTGGLVISAAIVAKHLRRTRRAAPDH